MGQISYGTITITDTTDIAEIYMIYGGSINDTDPPTWSYNAVTGGTIWKRNISEITDYDYIWQSTVITKSGINITSDNWTDFYNTPVCITGPEGQGGAPGKGISNIAIQYCNYGTGTPSESYTGWQNTVPSYDNSKPNYWTKTTITYTEGSPFVKIVKDNGITDAMTTANAANTAATNANANATEALNKVQAKYATSSTSATYAAKVATINPAVDSWSLFNGAEIFVKFTYKNTATSNLTLSIKPSSTGTATAAAGIRDANGDTLAADFYWEDNALVHFVYDGTYWRVLDITQKYNKLVSDLNGLSSTVGETNIKLLGNYAISSNTISTQNKTATITPTLNDWTLYEGATITVKFVNGNNNSAPTLNINSTGAKSIRAYSGNSVLTEDEYKWPAGTTITFFYDGTYWRIQDSVELTRISTAETQIKQTSDNVLIQATKNDTTAAAGGASLIQSIINVATSGIQISADKVNIEGAAIFTGNGRLSETSLNNAYDEIGAAEAVAATIPDDISDLSDSTGIIPTNVSDLTNDSGYQTASDISELIISATTLYYASNSATAPSKPTTHVTRNNTNTKGAWNIALPTYDASYPYLYTCIEYKTKNNTYSWSSVEQSTYTSAISNIKTTADAAAPKSSAVYRTQRIYYRKTTTGAPSANTTWLTSSGTGYGNWSLSIPQLTNSSNIKYPYLYTAVQTQTVEQYNNGTSCDCSTVLLDDSMTVIDGGTITTGKIAANRLDVGNWTIEEPGTAGIDNAYGGAIYTVPNGYSNNPSDGFGQPGTVIMTPGYNNDSIPIGGSTGQQEWFLTAGSRFGVTTDGIAYLQDIRIGDIGKDSLSDAMTMAKVVSSTMNSKEKSIEYILTQDTIKQNGKTYYTYNENNNTYSVFTGSTFVAGIQYYEKLAAIDSYSIKDISIHNNSTQSTEYIQISINIDENGLSFNQNQINNQQFVQSNRVAYINSSLDGVLYINKLEPMQLFFGNLEIINYNGGLAIRRKE